MHQRDCLNPANTKWSRYHTELANCSPVVIIDPGKLNASLPLRPSDGLPMPIFVLIGANDVIVDQYGISSDIIMLSYFHNGFYFREGIEETAGFHGVEPVIIKDMAHDVMLVGATCIRTCWTLSLGYSLGKGGSITP